MNKNRLLKNTLVYFLLILGFYLFYMIKIENSLYGDSEKGSTSKVNFVYQQF